MEGILKMVMTTRFTNIRCAFAICCLGSLPSVASAQVQTQSDIIARVTEAAPVEQMFIKDQPILGWRLESDDLTELPEVIRSNLGSVDDTGYDASYLSENLGSIVALQMTGDGPDFYIIGLQTFTDSYEIVALAEVAEKNGRLVDRLEMVPELATMFAENDPKLVGALKTVQVAMITMSDIGFDVTEEVTIEAPWGEQTKPAGQDAYLVYDTGEEQYYMVNAGADENPLSYVSAE